MTLLSGVFFPLDALPEAARLGSSLLPLNHVVELVRPLLAGQFQWPLLIHLAISVGFALFATLFAIWRFKRRLLQ